jgi:hypothetical protein
MKKLVILFSLMAATISLSAQKNEEQMLKQLVEDESTAFYKRDFKQWSTYYVQTNKTYWSCVEEGGTLEGHGWNNLKVLVGDYIKANPTPLAITLERKNYNFHLYPQNTVAWVTFDEYQTVDNKTTPFRSTRIFEKQKGVWKIVYMLSYPQNK